MKEHVVHVTLSEVAFEALRILAAKNQRGANEVVEDLIRRRAQALLCNDDSFEAVTPAELRCLDLLKLHDVDVRWGA